MAAWRQRTVSTYDVGVLRILLQCRLCRALCRWGLALWAEMYSFVAAAHGTVSPQDLEQGGLILNSYVDANFN